MTVTQSQTTSHTSHLSSLLLSSLIFSCLSYLDLLSLLSSLVFCSLPCLVETSLVSLFSSCLLSASLCSLFSSLVSLKYVQTNNQAQDLLSTMTSSHHVPLLFTMARQHPYTVLRSI